MNLKLALAAAAAALIGATSAQAQPVTYTMDGAHTFVTWEVRHLGMSTSRGRFDRKSGEVVLDRSAGTGLASVNIEMASISTGVAPFDNHLRSKDFFDVATHPTARFVGEFRLEGGRVTSVPGQLTLLGQTKPVTLRATGFACLDNHPMARKPACGGDFEATLKRSEWGMGYGLPGIPDDVRLVIQIEAIAN